MASIKSNKDIRRINFKYLVHKFQADGGSRLQAAQKLGYDDVSYFNQLFSGNIGDRTAKKITQGFDLPDAWIDLPHPSEWQEIGISEQESMDLIIDSLSDEQIGALFSRLANRFGKGSD